MKIVQGVTQYFSDDGKEFKTKDECEEYELNQKLKKYGLEDFSKYDLAIGNGLTTVDHLPFKAPWMGAFGACAVNIYEIKREDGQVLFGVGNEEPPILGWVKADDFYSEWPQ